MKTQFLLILFFFGLLFESAYSVSPKKDKVYEVPVFYKDRNKTKIRQVPQQTFKIGNYRYFLFRFKDLYKASDGIYPDYLFFHLNSSYMKNTISYAIANEKSSHINQNYDFNKLRFFSPNITYRKYVRHVRVSNYMAIYAKRTDERRRDTLIIKVNEMRNETMEMKPLSSLPSELKIQFDNMINSRKVVKITKKDDLRHNHDLYDHKDLKNDWHKINDKWRKVESDWKHLRDKMPQSSYDYNRKYYSGRRYRRFWGFFWFGMTIYFIGFIIIIAYILVNRRKKSFTDVLKNPVVPLNNQNV